MTTFELVSTIIAIVQLIVVVFTAANALSQLHHNRAGNELRALFAAQSDFRGPVVAEALRYVQNELAARLDDPVYRTELAKAGFVDPSKHPEMDLLNWFAGVGALVQNGVVDERLFLDIYGRLTVHYWALLEPAIALLRRTRGDGQYQSFEYLALRSRAWLARNPAGHKRASRAGRIDVRDPYAEADATLAPNA